MYKIKKSWRYNVQHGLFAEIHQRRAQGHHQRQGDQNEPNIHGGQQIDGNTHHKDGIENTGNDAAEHFLEHGSVTAQDLEQFAGVVLRYGLTVQLHQLVEGSVTQIRFQIQAQLLI